MTSFSLADAARNDSFNGASSRSSNAADDDDDDDDPPSYNQITISV
jgi:hypothetical protein